MPPGTELRSLLGTEDQTNCEFCTAHPVQLLPIELSEAEYIGSPAAVAALGLPDRRGVKAAIRLRLRTTADIPFGKLALDRLVFFLGGPEGARMRLYEQLVANVVQLHVRPAARPAPWLDSLPPSAIRPMGFHEDEALLPRAPQSFDGYRLLQEYYAMPERFLFMEISGLGRSVIRCATNELELVLLLDRADPLLSPGFGPDQLQLFCSPAINLFPRRSDRINLGEREVEHLVVPDRMRPLDFEVFSVTGVDGFSADGSAPQQFLPFYAANDLSKNPEHRCYYMLGRQPRQLSSRSRQRGRAPPISAMTCSSRWSTRSTRRSATRCARSASTCSAPTATCRCRCRSGGRRRTSPWWSALPSPPSAASSARRRPAPAAATARSRGASSPTSA